MNNLPIPCHGMPAASNALKSQAGSTQEGGSAPMNSNATEGTSAEAHPLDANNKSAPDFSSMLARKMVQAGGVLPIQEALPGTENVPQNDREPADVIAVDGSPLLAAFLPHLTGYTAPGAAPGSQKYAATEQADRVETDPVAFAAQIPASASAVPKTEKSFPGEQAEKTFPGAQAATALAATTDGTQKDKPEHTVKLSDAWQATPEHKVNTANLQQVEQPGGDGTRPDIIARLSESLSAPAVPATLQQAGAPAVGAPAAAAPSLPNMTAQLTTPLGNPQWNDEFSQKISWMISRQNQVAELHLTPPDLGPLDVVLTITGNQASAQFTSPHASVREAIEQALPRLRDMLAENGITLGNTSVSDHPPQQGWQDKAQGNSPSSPMSGPLDSVVEENSTAITTPISRHRGMIDTFA